jgi:AAHS family 4-hydroxybenzoate transporter-like MFS transporter
MPELGVRTETDLARLISESAWSRCQKWVVVLAALGFLMEGVAGQTLGPALPALVKAWHVSRASFAGATAMGLVGFGIGAALGGAICDRAGRRGTLIGSLFLLGVATVGTGFAGDVAQFGGWRLIAGLGLGATIPVATTYVADFTPARHRSVAIAFAVTFLPLGGFALGLMAASVLATRAWPYLFYSAGALPMVAAAAMVFALPESPRFLVHRAARRPELERLLGRMGLAVEPGSVLVDRSFRRGGNSFLNVFASGAVRDTLALWGAYFCLVLAMYSVFSWGPTAMVGQGFSLARASGALSTFAIGGVFGNFLSGGLTARYGSRVCFAALAVLAIAAAFALAFPAPEYRDELMFTWLLILGATVSGLQTALYALAAHVYPAAVRSTGLGLAVAWGRVGAILSSYTGVLSLDAGGPRLYFAGIGAAVVAMSVFVSLVANQVQRGDEK